MIGEAGLAAVVFAATDVDDLLILAAFFAAGRVRPRAIVVGQFLGIGVLVGVSVVAALVAANFSPRWVAWLGLVPILMGLWALRGVRNPLPDPLPEGRGGSSAPEGRGGNAILAVAGVTLANGGDNLGVYIPLFAAHAHSLPVFVIVFAVLTGVWCWLAHALVKHGRLGAALRRYGHVALPFVLMALGAWILYRGLA